MDITDIIMIIAIMVMVACVVAVAVEGNKLSKDMREILKAKEKMCIKQTLKAKQDNQVTIILTSTIDKSTTEFDVLNDIVQEVEGHIFVLDGSVKVDIK